MAKGIEINGQMRGKRGGVVYYRAAGQQISRARNFAPSNPKTAKQAVQRMILATASKVTAALRPIVNHSTEGVQAGEQSVRAFQRRAMLHLRDLASVYLDNVGAAVSAPANFAIKGAPIAGGADGLLVSVGQLNAPSYSIADGILTVRVTTPSEFAHSSAYVSWLGSMGMQPGDQLTIVAYQFLQSSSAASYGEDVNPVDRYRFARVVFKQPSEVDFTTPVPVFADGGRFNDALVERIEGQMPSGEAGTSLAFDFSEFGSWDTAAAAVIISRKLESGKFMYSSSRFAADRTYFDANNAYPVYETYMANVQGVNVGEVRYLQHAVAAPFQEAGA